MKSLFSKLLILTFSLLVLVSCTDDEETATTFTSWGIVYDVEGMDYDYKVILDDQTVLIPETSEVDIDLVEMDRVKVYFQFKDESTMGDDSINVNVEYVLVYSIKDVVKQSSPVGIDSLGTDAIAVYDGNVWQSNNLLNIPFAIDVSYDYAKVHSVNLVYFPDSLSTELGGVYMELRHNANNDEEDMVVDGFYSFDMESIEPFQNVVDSIPYTIVINPGAFNGAAERFEGYYKPSDID